MKDKDKTPEKYRFLRRVGRVYLGPKEMDEPTAIKLNQIIDDIESGKIKGSSLPKEWADEDEKIKQKWIEKHKKW